GARPGHCGALCIASPDRCGGPGGSHGGTGGWTRGDTGNGGTTGGRGWTAMERRGGPPDRSRVPRDCYPRACGWPGPTGAAGSPHRMTAALLRFELAGARRARVATIFAVGFAVAGIGVALAGLSAGGVLSVQGFARTSMSLLQMVLWVVPMLALL